MRLCPLLILFLVQWEKGPGLVRAQTVLKEAEGGNITFRCIQSKSFFHTGKKMFCKSSCDTGVVLVETSGNAAHNGRYSIESERRSLLIRIYVSIRNVIRSDSGEYLCVSENPSRVKKFTIEVTGASPITSAVTTRQSLNPEPDSTTTGFIYLLLLIPVVMAIVFGLIFYRKRKYQNAQEITKRGANTEIVSYKNLSPPPASSQTDNIYQSLSSSTRDHNQIYSTLTALPQGSSRSETNTNTETSPPGGKCYNLYN